MFNILINLRIQRKRLNFYFVVSIVFLSATLTACGGGSGPDEGGDGSLANSNSSTSNSTKSFAISSSSSTIESIFESEYLCQQQNSLLCEDFEWSSSLSYKASEQDWNLKGWQYQGLADSGTACNSEGANSSQCALKWVQQRNTDTGTNTLQQARYNFSAYGAGEQYVAVSWFSKWSGNWQWATKPSRLFDLEALDINQTLTTVASVEVDTNGVIQLRVNHSDCTDTNTTFKAASGENNLIGNNQTEWQSFELIYDNKSSVVNTTIQLKVNNNVIITADIAKTSCNTSGEVHAITFSSNANNDNAVTQQSLMIDNVSVVYY